MDTSPRNIQIKYKSGYFPHQYSDQMKVDTSHTNIQTNCKSGYFPH